MRIVNKSVLNYPQGLSETAPKQHMPLLALALKTLGKQMSTYWTQSEWRLDRSYQSTTEFNDPYDSLCVIYATTLMSFDPKVTKKMKRILAKSGYQLSENGNILSIQIDETNARKRKFKPHKLLPPPEEILEKREERRQANLQKIHTIVESSVKKHPCDRYEFTFIGFDPNLIEDYKTDFLSANEGLKVHDHKVKWKEKAVTVSDDESMVVYRPVAKITLIASDLFLYGLRSRFKFLTSNYAKTVQFGGLDKET